MPADDLAAFVAQVRAECDTALARLDTVDPATLSPDVRRKYEKQRRRWLNLRALTEGDAVDLHLAAAEHAGRELTQDESGALAKSVGDVKGHRAVRLPDGSSILDGGYDEPTYTRRKR